MTYPAPTNEQTLVIAVAIIAPLVWALTHHGNQRRDTLMLWVPWLLFVSRVIYMNPRPTAPLEQRVRWAVEDIFMDPMTIGWPAFVFVTFGLIGAVTARRQQREANIRAAASANPPPSPASERPAAPTGLPKPPSPQLQPERERVITGADTAVAERIRMLGALRDDGLLTEEEFQQKKSAVLSAWP
jgi:hypothetical protein